MTRWPGIHRSWARLAVDPTGNVALVLDHGDAFTRVRRGAAAFLPFIRK